MSDHLSSPRALKDPVIDLTDLFVFPVPDATGRLAAVMNVFPGALPGAVFSDAVAYRFRFVPASPDAAGVIRARPEQEVSIEFTFGEVDAASGAQAGCCRYRGERIAFRTGAAGVLRTPAMSVFAGLRRDPFFMDVRHDVITRTTRRLSFQEQGVDAVRDLNVLAIVIEFDAARVLGEDRLPLWAVAAETTSRGTPAARFERFGRPEVKNILLASVADDPVNRAVELRDVYNLEDPFAVSPSAAEAFRARIDANLELLDGLDGDIAWPFEGGEHHPLTETVLNDHLVVDTTKPFSEDGYLEIERSTLAGRRHATCGGRWLNYDVIDALYTIAVGGWDGPRISDGVDAAVTPASRAFPYLAEPNLNPPVPDPGVPVHAAA